MKRKKKKRKKPALRSPALTSQEKIKIANHEDIALKTTAQFFRDEIMPALHIEGKVVSIFPTESIQLDLKRGFEDFNYLMEDGSIKHFEFMSTNEGTRGLRRFRWYEAQLSYQHGRPVTTYVLFSGKIKNPLTELVEGGNTYRIHPIVMQGYHADEVIGKLQRKVEVGESLTKADLLPLVLTPLMDGELSQMERISAAYKITQRAVDTDAETIRKVEAIVYIMAEKFLETAEMEQLRKEITMTRLGQMIYNDGVAEGEARGEALGKTRGEMKLSKLITILLRDNLLSDIAIATSDEKAREEYYVKYGIE